MKAIIMAGGEGSRLRPLTCDLPKPLVPVANKPVMAYAIDLLRCLGITEIGVTLQYLPDMIQDYFGDGREWGVNLHYFIEESPLGTAGSVKNAEKFLDERFLVVSGDALTDFKLQRAVDFHREKGALATLVLTGVTAPLEYGVVITGQDGRIERFLEKPRWSQVFSDQVNTGIYVLEPEVLDWIPRGEMSDFSKDIFPRLLAAREALCGCPLEGYWCDIGDLDQYRQAHYDLLGGKVNADIPFPLLEKGLWVSATAAIAPGVKLIPPAIVGDGCYLEKGSSAGPYSVLGSNVLLRRSASSKRSILWQGSQLSRGAQTRGAVLCDRVRMAEYSQVLEGAVIGKDSFLQARSIIKPGIKLWPEKTVAEGVVQQESIVWGGSNAKHLFGQEGVSGLLNQEITPELTLRLGLACGTEKKASDSMALGTDGSKAALVLKQAFLSGLLSSGVNVIDFGTLALPVQRFACRTMALAGVHIKDCGDDRGNFCITFVDRRGINISPGSERKIENFYHRQEFRRAESDALGTVQYRPGLNQDYLSFLKQSLEAESILRRKWRLVVGCGEPLRHILPEILDELGCELIDISPAPGGEVPTFNFYLGSTEKFAELVAGQGADLGVIFDGNGERFLVVDGQGRKIGPEQSYVTLAAILLLNGITKVALPVTEPDSIERLAARTGAAVERTAATPFAILEKAEDVGENYRQSWLQFDGIQIFFRLLELLSKKDWNLQHFLEEIPQAFMHSSSVDCPWEAKGKVMRSLIEQEQTSQSRLELTDGIKVHGSKGWALVLPHAEAPLYKVIAQGYSQEAAEELTNFYLSRIGKIVEEK